MTQNRAPWMLKQGPFDFMRAYLFMLERYASDTQEMSTAEEAVYIRLRNWCLKNESALPLDIKECRRIARTQTPEDRRAVDRVLRERFRVYPDGYSEEFLEKTISEWKGKKPVLDAKRELKKLRQERWRKKQQDGAKLAHENGVPWQDNPTAQQMDERLAAAGVPVNTTVDKVNGVTRYETRFGDAGDASRDASLDAVTQELELEKERVLTHSPRVSAGEGTGAGHACRAMRQVGLVGTNPSHPQLLALVAGGASLDHFAATAASAVARGKGFAWVLAVVEAQLRDGERTAQSLADRKHGEASSVMSQLAPSLVKKH